MPITINGTGPIDGITSLNTSVSSTELGFLDGVTSALQTQINTAGGLVKIVDSSFSAQSSVSINNCFSSTYENYRIFLTGSNANVSNITLRFRSSGTDNSTSNYFSAKSLITQTGTASTSVVNPGTSFIISSNIVSSVIVAMSFDVFRPNKSEYTNIHGGGFDTVSSSYGYQSMTGSFNAFTVFDGFSIINSSGNFSGTIRVYGYRN